MSHDDLIGAEEAAPILGLSSRTVKRMAGDGRLTFITRLSGGAYVFSRSDVIAKRARLDEIAALEAKLAEVRTEANTGVAS